MPTQEWLSKEFNYGYDSGDVLALVPDEVRKKEETLIGGSYRRVFCEGALPYLAPDSRVMELGPGKGSWSRAILKYIPRGELHTFDFQDVRQWLHPELHGGRLTCHQVSDNYFSAVPDNYFDFFWSVGVLCHNNAADICKIFANSIRKMKPGGIAVQHFGDWDKLARYGFERGGVPREFTSLPDNQIWWPRNNKQQMAEIAEGTGWRVIMSDMELVERDAIILMQKP